MNTKYQSYPFNLPNTVFKQIIASIPGLYQISNPWNRSAENTILTPTNIAIDIQGEGITQQSSVSISLDDSLNYDTGLSTDYTTPANRDGVWLYIYAYSSNGVLSYKLSDVATGLNAPIQKYRLIEQFYCIGSNGLNHLGVASGLTVGDIDSASFASLTGESVKMLSGTSFPDASLTEIMFYKTDEAKLYFSNGVNWIRMDSGEVFDRAGFNEVLNLSQEYNDITEDHELFMDGTSSLVTSKGRKPITEYSGGTYIPPTINIDGVEYPNPSNIGGSENGSWGFFKAWENVKWKESSDWDGGSGVTITKEGDWLRLEATADGVFCYITNTLTSDRFGAGLVKYGNASTVYIGDFASTIEDSRLTFGEGVVNGTSVEVLESVNLSDSLCYFAVKGGNASGSGIAFKFVSSGDYIYLRDFQSTVGIDFIPPYGMDGKSQDDALAYNFDKWDYPMSFKFKPQFDYDTENYHYILGAESTDTNNLGFIYNKDIKLYQIYLGGVGYFIGWNGTEWECEIDSVSTLTAFSSNEKLQTELNVKFLFDITNGTFTLYFDDQLLVDADASFDITDLTFESIYIGNNINSGLPTSVLNSYISDFTIHPKDTDLSTITFDKPYRNPKKTYGKNSQFSLDEFGNITSANGLIRNHGNLVKKGQNVNGHYRIYEDGFKECWGTVTVGSVAITNSWGALYTNDPSTAPLAYFPIKFNALPHTAHYTQSSTATYGWIPYISGGVTPYTEAYIKLIFARATSATTTMIVNVYACGY